VIIKPFEKVRLYGKKVIEIIAKIDTGAYRSSIDKELAGELGLREVGEKGFRSSLGRERRKLVKLKFELAGKLIETEVSVADRSRMKYKMIVGRRDLKGFSVKID